MTRNGDGVTVHRKWLKLGVAVALLQYVSLFLIALLFQFDFYVAVAVVVIGGTVGGVIFTIYVLYVY